MPMDSEKPVGPMATRAMPSRAAIRSMVKQVEHLYTGQYWVKHFQMGVPGP